MSTRPGLILLALAAAPAFAGEVKTPGAGVPAVPTLGAPAIPGPAADALTPVASIPGPVAILPTDAVKGTGPEIAAPVVPTIERVAEAVAPQVELIEKPQAAPAESAEAGRRIEDAVVGGRSIETAAAAPVAAAPSAGLAALPPSGASGSASVPSAPPPAAKPSAPRVAKVDGRVSYGLRRRLLASLATTFGVVYSLPQAGPRLTAALIEKAAGKTALFLDYDKTLAGWNQRSPAALSARIAAVKASGKLVAIVSDRPAFLEREGSPVKSLADSLSTLSPEQRAGLIVASPTDATIYRYDKSGEPVVLEQMKPISEAMWSSLGDAVKSVLKDGASRGVVMQREDRGSHAYSLILKAGTPREAVLLAEELLKREFASKAELGALKIVARFPANPAQEPYLNIVKADKTWAMGWLVEKHKVVPEDALILGDSFFAPDEGRGSGLLIRAARRLARRLSGQPQPPNGFAGDAGMEEPLPGALTLSVGKTATASLRNAFVLDGEGAEVSARVLDASAAEGAAALERTRLHGGGPKAARGEPLGDDVHPALQIFLVLLLIAAVVAGWMAFAYAFSEIIKQGESLQYQDPFEGFY